MSSEHSIRRPSRGRSGGLLAGLRWPGAVLFAGLVLAYPAAAVETGVYAPPNPHGFAVHQRYEADGDGDDLKETSIVRYRNPLGDSLFSMATGDRLWAWSLATNGADAADLDRNYVIRDGDCDGVFDERYALDEEYHVPDCVK